MVNGKDIFKGGILFTIMLFILTAFSQPAYVESGTRPRIIHGEMWNYTSNLTAWDFEFPEGTGVYHNLSNLSAGNLNGFTFTDNDGSDGGSYLTAQYAGVYKVTWHISLSSDANKDLYGFMAAINGDKNTARECYAREDFPLKNNVGAAAGGCIMDLDVGDTINILVENEVDSNGLNIHTVNVNAMRIDN